MNQIKLSRKTPLSQLKKPKLYEQAIASIVKKKGFEDIKANIKGYNQPTSYLSSVTGNEYIPDITAQRLGRKSYFELAIKNKLTKQVVSKWELLSNLALLNKGKFHIIAPRGHYAFAQRICAKNNIFANIIKL